MATLNDAKFDALRAQGFTGAVNDMVLQWLQFFGATSNAIPDAWLEMLALKGATQPFQRNDAWFDLLGRSGFLGQYNDRELAFWIDGGIIPPFDTSGYQSDDDGLNFVNYDSGLQWHTGLDFEIVIEMVWDGSPVLSNDYVFRYGEGGEENLLFMNFGVGFAADGAIFYGHIAPNGNFIQTSTIPFGKANTVVTVRMAYDQSSLTIERGWTTEDGDSGEDNSGLTLSTRQYADTNVMIFAETSGDTQAGFFVRNAIMTVGITEVVNATCNEGNGLISVNTGTGADGVISREEVHTRELVHVDSDIITVDNDIITVDI